MSGAPLSLSGLIFSAQQEVLRELAGPAYERAIASHSDEVRLMVQTTASIGWVPFDVVEAVMSSVARELGRPTERLQREVAQKVAERTVTGVWRLLARFSSADAIVGRVGTLWGRTYSQGSAHLEVPREGSGELVVRGLPSASDFMLRGVAYALEALLEVTRKRIARVQWRRTNDGAVYTVTSRAR